MAKLITGGTGFIGAELAHLLVAKGEETVLFDRTVKRHRIDDIESRVKAIQGDQGNASEVINAVKNNKITEIYHIGSMLTIASENNPWSAFRANIIGMYNILEAARLFDVEKVLFTSSFGSFGLDIGSEVTDTTLQRPTTFYGVGKLYSEGLGRYYRTRFGMDFRCLRLPAVIGPTVKTPGHWFNPMIENVVSGKPFECPVSEDALMPPSLFIKDAALAAYQLLHAPKEQIQTVNYNVTSVRDAVSAAVLEKAIKKYFPAAVITYKPDPNALMQQNKMSQILVVNDDCARQEWGWKPQYDSVDRLISGFIARMKK